MRRLRVWLGVAVHRFIKELRIANSSACKLNMTSLLTARFFRTFATDNPAAFAANIRRACVVSPGRSCARTLTPPNPAVGGAGNASRDGGWSWERFDRGDGLTGCEMMRRDFNKLKEALADLKAAVPKADAVDGAPPPPAMHEVEELEQTVALYVLACLCSPRGCLRAAHMIMWFTHACGCRGCDLVWLLHALGIPSSWEAKLPLCVASWEKQWKNALAGTKASGAVTHLLACFEEAKKRRNQAYGSGVNIVGERFDHEWAYKAVADKASRAAAKLEAAGSKAGGSEDQRAGWISTLEQAAAEARKLHVELCMEFGLKFEHAYSTRSPCPCVQGGL